MAMSGSEAWPPLPYAEWQDTYRTLHLWTQIVGKVRLACEPWLNHSWHTTLHVTPRGLGTGPIPVRERTVDIEFDFVASVLRVRSDGPEMLLPLSATPVAEFYRMLTEALEELGAAVVIGTSPNEIADAIAFPSDVAPRVYEPAQALRYFQVLTQVDRVFKRFRTGFLGKASPVHFFWGGFDLAVTRFSGRTAPLHPGGIPNMPDAVTREAYSHEVSSAGFWPGGPGAEEALFYAYAYPEPPGFRTAAGAPAAARYDTQLGEYVLPYEAVRTAADPEALLMQFLQATYEAAADSAGWDRAALECPLGECGRPRVI